MKSGYTEKDAVMVFPTSYDPKINFESTTLRPFITQEITVPSGHRYFMTVYAKIKLIQAEDAKSSKIMETMRVVYATVEFEYRSFFYPIELVASTIGLIGIILATCCVFNSGVIQKLKAKIGFQRIGDQGVDQDLEAYFMQIKNDYEVMEQKKRSSENTRALVGSPDSSAIHPEPDLGNTSAILDVSITGEPAQTAHKKKKKNKNSHQTSEQAEPVLPEESKETKETELV